MSDLHADARRVLSDWSAPDAAQQRLRDAYLEHLRVHPDGVWRTCTAGHLTASALIVDPRRGRVLLTLHGRIGRWLQTGGHCEPGDATLAGVALREATEESGITGLTMLPGGPVGLDRHLTPCAWHLDVQYAVLAPQGAVETRSEESLDVRWFPFEAVDEVADASVRRLARRARALL